MYFSHIRLSNWKNFREASVDLNQRVFMVGPNASGKSNFLDVFRFLHDLAKQGGGLQEALSVRGGLSKIRCLAARRHPNVEIEVEISEFGEPSPRWKYAIGIKQEAAGLHLPILDYERVWRNGEEIITRPQAEDQADKERLRYTFLEQVTANSLFRDVAKFFETINYQHLIPQLVRNPEAFTGPGLPGDPYGKTFLERIQQTPDRVRQARLKKIEDILKKAVPQLTQLHDIRDEFGNPHLEAIYEHWRPTGAKQREDQFSDGTLRLLALLWTLYEGDSPLLLEEPELSLHSGIVRHLPGMLHRILRDKRRQVILTTHSWEMLSDKGIGGEEVIMLLPGKEGSDVIQASLKEYIHTLLDSGLSVAEAVMPLTKPQNIEQMVLSL